MVKVVSIVASYITCNHFRYLIINAYTISIQKRPELKVIFWPFPYSLIIDLKDQTCQGYAFAIPLEYRFLGCCETIQILQVQRCKWRIDPRVSLINQVQSSWIAQECVLHPSDKGNADSSRTGLCADNRAYLGEDILDGVDTFASPLKQLMCFISCVCVQCCQTNRLPASNTLLCQLNQTQ